MSFFWIYAGPSNTYQLISPLGIRRLHKYIYYFIFEVLVCSRVTKSSENILKLLLGYNDSGWIMDVQVSWEIPILAFPSDNIFNTKYLTKDILLEVAVYDEYRCRYIYSGTVHI